MKNRCKGNSGKNKRRRQLVEELVAGTSSTTTSVRRRLSSSSSEQPTDMLSRKLGFDWDREDSIPKALEKAEKLRAFAKELRGLALDHQLAGESEMEAALVEEASLLEDTAALLVEKAQLVGERNYLQQQQANLVAGSGVNSTVSELLDSIELDILKIKDEMTKKQREMKDLQAERKASGKYDKKRVEYESVWQKAIEALGITEHELKCVGKVEQALNRVVKWFSLKYGCELGVVVVRML